MLEQLNGCLLNQVINGILFLFLSILFVISLLDRRYSDNPRDRYFSQFIFFCALYIGMHVIWLTAVDTGACDDVIILIRLLRILAIFAAYCSIGLWLLFFVREKKAISDKCIKAIYVTVVSLFAVSQLIAVITGNYFAANIPIMAYYLFLECFILRYRHILGKSPTLIMTLFIIPSLALLAQEWWNYTPANIYLVIILMVIYSRMWIEQRRQQLEERRIMAEQYADLENARTKLVLSQIKPHFLFNTLGTIAYLCEQSPQDAERLTYDLSRYLRGNLSALDGGRMIPFSRELEHVKTYLGIELVRFEDSLHVEYDIQSTDFRVPALTVEPLVENAVKHGICQKEGGGSIRIASREDQSCFVVTIADDGVGFDAEDYNPNNPEHIGIHSVRSRIELLVGGSLSVTSTKGFGTSAVLRIPKDKST